MSELKLFRPGARPVASVGEAAPKRPSAPPLGSGSLFRPGQPVDPARVAAMRAQLLRRRFPDAPAEVVDLMAVFPEASAGLDPHTLQLLAQLVPGRSVLDLLRVRNRYNELRRYWQRLDQLDARRRPAPPPPPPDDDELPF